MSNLLLRSLARVAFAVSVFGLCAGFAPAPNHEITLLKFKVTAAETADYSVKCRFPSYKIQGSLINTMSIRHKGPVADTIPSDRPRCTLHLFSGPGPVTLTIFKYKAYTATVTKPGEEAKVFVY